MYAEGSLKVEEEGKANKISKGKAGYIGRVVNLGVHQKLLVERANNQGVCAPSRG